MADLQLLEKTLRDRQVRKKGLAKYIGLSQQGFDLKLKGKIDFKLGEVEKIVEFLRLTNEERDEIFFPDSVRKSITQ